MPQPAKGSTSSPTKRKTLTLRVDPATAKRLHSFSLKRAKELGKTPSYNDCLIHLIHQASR